MRIIDVDHLEHWADTLQARAEFPRLLGDLIRATAERIGAFRFPADNAAQMHGFDGILSAEGMPPYVPGGDSIWELGTGKNVAEKAEADYQKRKKDTRGRDPKATTYVAATLRSWQDADKWAQEKSKEGFWLTVKAIDAVDLVGWLSTCEAVALRLAGDLGLSPKHGLMSANAFWNQYSKSFSPQLKEAVLIAGRVEQVSEFLNRLQGQHGAIRVQADSLEEVIAFAVAAVRSAPPGVREYLEARTVVLGTEEAAEAFSNRRNFIFLLQARASMSAGQLAYSGPTVVPLGRDDRGMGDSIRLDRPLAGDLASALETMGLGNEEARRLARSCGRSVTVLARLRPSAYARKPQWDGNSDLLPALLAGAWDEAKEQDRYRLAELAGARKDHETVYQDIESKFRQLARMPDPPLEREGTVWTIRAPVDAFLYLGHLLGATELESLSRVVTIVFSEHNPILDLPIDERPYADMHNQTLSHSSWLRNGLAKSLLVITQFHQQAQWGVPVEPSRFVEGLIENLPGLRDSYRAVADLADELAILMEAAPRPLFEALEHLLQGDGQAIRPIFQDAEDGVFGPSSPHTGLLWALEVAAWNPRFLTRAALLLAALARVDPGGRLSNRPINSLTRIFLPWRPSTNARLPNRVAALDRIVAAEPGIGWKLILALLPGATRVTSGTSSPRYDDAGVSEREVLTYGIVHAAQDAVVDSAIAMAGEVPDRWSELLPRLGGLNPVQRKRLQSGLLRASTNKELFRGSSVWAAVRDVLAWHREHPEAAWALPESELASWEVIVSALEPDDLLARTSWLFNDHYPLLGRGRQRQEATGETRKKAVAGLIAAKGEDAILELAANVAYPGLVALAYFGAGRSYERSFQLLCQSVQGSERLQQFAVTLSSVGRQEFGARWQERFRDAHKSGTWTDPQAAQLLRNWPDERPTWEFARFLGEAVWREYWATKPIWYVDMPADDLEYAIDAYLSVRRAAGAVQFLNGRGNQIRTESIFKLLDGIVPEINAGLPDAVGDIRHDVENLFEVLRSRPEVSSLEIARREYAYLPLFGYDAKHLTLHSLLAGDPDFFVRLLCDVFRPENGDERPGIDEEATTRARLGYQLLSDFDVVPGCNAGVLDIGALTQWISAVLDGATNAGRRSVSLDQIGRVLAHSPVDSDGHWPSRGVSDLIEQLKSDQVEEGIRIQRYNMRGTTVRGPFEGGEQERELAATIQAAARARRGWPRTQSLLERMADRWLREAESEDVRARQDANRFD